MCQPSWDDFDRLMMKSNDLFGQIEIQLLAMEEEGQSGPLVQKRQTYKSMGTISAIALNISLSFFYFGYVIVYLGSIDVAVLKRIYSIDLSESTASGILNGIIPIGALFGALSSSFFIARFSRRKCLFIGNAMAFVAGCLIYIEYFYSLLFFRLLQGFCVGLFSAVAPLIVKELSPTEISGTLGTFNQLNVTLGVFLGTFFTYILKKITGDETGEKFWFITFGLTQVTILVQTLILIFVYPYETPKYLLSIGKEEEARKLITIIYKQEYVQQILEEKKNDLKSNTNNRSERDVESTLSQPIMNDRPDNNSVSSKVPIIVAFHLAIMQQFSGINGVAVYGGKIASQATSGEIASLMPSLINFEQVLATFITGYLLSKFGRRTILNVGSLFITIACTLVAVGFFVKQSQKADMPPGQISAQATALILIGLFFFMAVFGLSLGPVVWLYIPEIVGPKVVPYSTMANWITASLVILLFPIITDDVLDGNPGGLFIFFTIWSLGSTIFSHFYVLQTKDKTQRAIKQQYQNLKLC